MTGQIVLLGATGFAGGLALEAMLRRGMRPLLAGHDEIALRDLAERTGGLLTAYADVDDPATLTELVDEGDVLVSAVGPFNNLGRNAALAAVQQNAHYVDCSGEVDFVRWLLGAVDEQARAQELTLVPSCGNTFVTGLLASALACERADGLVSAVDVGYFVQGHASDMRSVSRGTRLTFVEALERPAVSREGGRLVTSQVGSLQRQFPLGGQQVAAILSGGTETLFVPRHRPDIVDVHVYNGWYTRLATPVRLVTSAARALRRLPLGDKAMAAFTGAVAGDGAGPDAETRTTMNTAVVAQAKDARGNAVSTVELVGPKPYELTAELMAWTAEEIAAGRARAVGVVDPIQAFGIDALQAVCESMGLAEA